MVTLLTPRDAASNRHQKLMQALCTLVVGVAVFGSTSDALARRSPDVEIRQSQQSVVQLSGLPSQAQDVYRRIASGGPFAYEKDGIVFGNRERSLPRRPRGFYREYTVPTPGARDRGPRRIVCGGKDLRRPETCFYTQDHYNTFYQIDPRY